MGAGPGRGWAMPQPEVKDYITLNYIVFPFPSLKANANILSGKGWTPVVQWQFIQFTQI